MDPTIQAAVRHYMDRSDVLVITRLQCNNTGQQITVGNIHVTWGEMKVPDVQSLQVIIFSMIAIGKNLLDFY